MKIDPVLHAEILARYEKLHLAPYKGFVNPVYEAVTDKDGNIIDVKVSYNEGYAEQCYVIAKNLRIFLIEMNKNKYGCTRNNKGHKGQFRLFMNGVVSKVCVRRD